MAIPFPPDGPQVQAALQKVPTPQLQQYAAGRPPQPTGQVTPGPMGAAATALNERNAMGAANQRQMAMQNDPANSPTIFQQKDAEIAQARAALQQAQQKEQQLGIVGALMAKKAQDLQARERGVAALPTPQDMFTAMDGGIVFSGGGNVKGYSGKDNESQVKGLYSRGILETLADVFSQLYGTSFEEGMARTKEGQRDKALREELSRVPSTVGEPEPTVYAKEPDKSKDKKEPSPLNKVAVPERTGLPSLPQSSTYLSQLGKVAPVSTARSDALIKEQIDLSKKIESAISSGQMSEEEGKRLMQAHMAERAKIQEGYVKDRGTRQEEIRKAMEGEKPNIWKGIAAGLPTDLRGMRLAGGIASIAKGVAGQEAEYDKRRREAAIEDAKSKQLFAQADKEFALGNIEAGNKFLKEAREEKAKASDRAARAYQARSEGLSADLAQVVRGETAARDVAKTEFGAKSDLLGRQMTGDIQARLAQFGADREERLAAIRENYARTRDPEMITLAKAMGVDPKELFMARYGPKTKPNVADPAKAFQVVNSLTFNDPMLVSRAGLTEDEILKVQRSKTEADVPPEIKRKLNRGKEIMYQQMTTGAADESLFK